MVLVMTLADVAERLGITHLWSRGMTGKGIRVAVIDTGVNSNHPMLKDKVIIKHNLTDGDIEDGIIGHGTWVASAIAGNMVNTAKGLFGGLAPDVQIVNIKVLNDNGEGLFSQIIEGIYLAIKDGCHIINMSLGSNYDDGGESPLSQAIDYATSKGVICICAAGNAGPGRSPNTPATARTAIAVGSANTRNEVSVFSSRGEAKNKSPFPTVCAYGGESTSVGGYSDESILGAYTGTSYINFKGTSMATPMVSATLALIMSSNSSVGYDTVINALKTTSIDISTSGVDVNAGYGLIDPTSLDSVIGVSIITTLIKYSALMGGTYYLYKHITKD